MEVTASGMLRARRQEIKELVERLRGFYAGGLTVGRTAAVVVDGTPDWQQPKLAAAAANDIPVVSAEWLEDSALHGFLLCPVNYRLLPGQSRRSSAASTNADVSAAPAVPAPLLPAASHQPEPAAVKALLEPAGSPGSPEVECLRGEGRLPEGSPWGPAFLDALPGASGTPCAAGVGSRSSPAPIMVQNPFVAPDALDAQLHSPSSPAACASADPLRLPSPLPPPGESCLPPPAPADVDVHAEEATPLPAPGAAGSPAPQQGQTDSDTMIARFLSRMPQVTVARGSCVPRWQTSGSSASSSCCGQVSPGGLLGSRDGTGAAERRDSWRLSGGGTAGEISLGRLERGRVMQLSPDSEAAPLHELAFESPTHACGHDGLSPPHGSPVEGCLPATTLIRLGAQSRQPPAASTLEGIRELHGSDGGVVPDATFYESAEALPAGGPSCTFVAGDATHGARILYDVGEAGKPEYALALVQSIYRLGDEAWMEHRYLLGSEDLLQRPRWAAAAKGLRAGELLLSACSYHSPMHLICGDFQLSFPGHALRLGRAGGRSGHRRVHRQAHTKQRDVPGRGSMAAAYTCRRGFDTAAGQVVPLRQALEGFQAA